MARRKFNWSDYVKSAFLFRFIPKDQFSHAYYLLSSEPKDISEFQELISKHALLGNIDSDRLMRFYQNDVHFLTNFFEMQQREPALKNFFKVIYTAWVFEVALTRTKKGMERQLQTFGPAQPKSVEGFGKLIEQLQKKKEKDSGEMVVLYE